MSLLINEFINQMTLRIDSGVSIEINVFLREQERIKSYSISVSDDRVYNINVELYKFSKELAEQLFDDFVKFMKLSHRTYYERTCGKDCIKYDFISTDEGGVGFYCKINFE